MAYREPEELTCPACSRTADIVWVIGEGPNTKPGEAPAYTDVLEDGGWIVETAGTAPRWNGRITCPDCGALVRA